MNKNVKKIWKRWLAVITMAVCLMVSSAPAMAYEESKTVEGNYYPINGWDGVSSMQFNAKQNRTELDLSTLDFAHSHVIFISQNGQVFECEEGQLVEGRVFCFHDYVAGTVAFHEAFSDGSCLVTTYDAMRCDICGRIVLGQKKYDEFYFTCPHPNGIL